MISRFFFGVWTDVLLKELVDLVDGVRIKAIINFAHLGLDFGVIHGYIVYEMILKKSAI